MPNPVQDLTTQAVMRAAETSPDDAAYAVQRQINPALMGAEAKTAEEQDQQKRLYGVLASTVEGNAWLRAAGNAELAAQNLKQLAAIRADVEAMQLPDPLGPTAQFGAILKQSARRAAMGTVAVAGAPFAAVQSLGQLATGGDPWENSLTRLADVANAYESDEARRLEDIEYSRRRLGGSKVTHIVASVLGQAPEMLATGFGTATAVRGAIGQGMRKFLFEYAESAGRAALTPAQLSKAITGTAFVQGSFEGGRTFVDRMQKNAADGKDLITSADVAAAMATMAIVVLTEGFVDGGEMSVLSAGAQRTRSEVYRSAMRDAIIQPGQEFVQEVSQNIVSDLADGKYVNWDEAGWAGLAGAIGGTMFAAPSLIQAFHAGRSLPDQIKAQAYTPLLRTAAKSPEVVHNVATIEQVRASVAAMPGVANLPASKMSEMVAAAAPSLKQQHIDIPQFTAISESKGMTVEELAQAWNATIDSGQASLKTTDLAVALSQEKPDVVAAVYDAVRSEPDAPSLKDMQDALPELQKLAQGDIKETLPDGTVDDTEPVTKDIAEFIMAASNKKITPAMAKATAELWTQAYRGAAIRWNNAAAKAGKSERKTTANIWVDVKPTMVQGEVVGMSQSNQNPVGWGEVETSAPESITAEQAFEKSFVPASDANKQFIELVSQAFGVEIILHETFGSYAENYQGSRGLKPHNVAGYYSRSQKRVHIASRKSIRSTVMHEVGHAVLRTLPEEKQAAILGAIYKASTAKSREQVSQTWRTFDDNIIADETLAESVATLLYERPDFVLNTIATPETRGVFVEWYQKIADRIERIVAKIRGMPASAKRKNELQDIAESMMKERAEIVKAMKPQPAKVYTKTEEDAIWKGIATDAPAGDPVLLQPGDRAAYDPFKKIIGLGDKADVTSVNHELMHHWLDTTQQYAQQDGAPPEFREDLEAIGAWATKSAGKVVEHAAKSGIPVTEDQVIATAKDMVGMRIMSPGGRAIHEAVTGAFEQYLASGRAPSKTLQVVFARMKRWFTSIYRTMLHANATGTDLLTPEIEAVFRRILRSQDQAEAGSFKSLSPEVLKVSGGVYDELYKAHAQEIDEAQAALDAKLVKQAEALTEQDKAALIAEQREALAVQPVYKAQIMLATNKLDAALVNKALAGTGSTPDLTAWVAAIGQDPDQVAIEAGFESPQSMLEALSKAPMLDAEATRLAEEIWAGNGYLTPSERVDQMRQSNQYRLKLAMVERAIIASALRSTNVATAEGEAKAERMTAEAVEAERAKWKARTDQIAEQAKLQKKSWDTESAILLNEMRQDYGSAIRDGAAYRMETAPKTSSAIAKDIADKSVKLAKLVSHGDWRGALLTHWDIATLAEMQRLVNDSTQQQAKDAKKLTAEALRKQATMDAALMAELASAKASKIPVSEMRLGQWEKRADAARARRERYVADQNIAGILRSTNEIAWAEAMAAETNRILSLETGLAEYIRKQTGPEATKILQTHGLPAVIDDKGITHVFSTEREQDIFFANNGSAANGYTKTRSDDLTSVASGIRSLLSPTKQADAEAAFGLMISRKLSGYNLLSNEFINLVTLRADPKKWTEDDYLVVTAQLESIHKTAKLRPAFSNRIDSAAQELIGVLDGKLKDRKPHTQETDMSVPRYMLEASISSQANLRTTVSDLGDVGKRLFVDMSAMAEENQRGMAERIKKQLDAAYQQFSIADRRRLDTPVVVDGVQGDGWSRLGRLMMWGTESGRQRVREDLRLYGAADPDAYMRKQMQGLTAAEINFLNTMWSANEQIWTFTQGAAREVGKPIPRTLKASAFSVTDDSGKTVLLSGGYASVPYKDHFPEAHLIDPNTGQMARLDDSSLFERADTVKGRHLDLTLDAQYQRMLSRIRLGAYMQPANFLSSLLANKDLRFKMEERFGADWVLRLIGHFSFTFNGLPREGMGAGMLMGNMQSAVYAFNPLTAIKQPLGIINAAPHPNIGTMAMLTSVRQFLAGGYTGMRQMHKRVAEMSFRYRDRLDNSNVDIQAPSDSIGRANTLTMYRRATTWMMRRAQMTADVITWNACYQRQYMDRISKGMSPEEARYESRKIADDTLFETQGSAWRTESAVINQTRMGQIMTFSGKWMINYSNYLYRLYRTARTDGSWESWLKFSNSVFTGLVLSSAAMAAANAILRPRDDELPDPDASDYARRIALDVVGSPVWWARAAIPPLYSTVTGEPSSMTTLFPADMFMRDAKTVAAQVNNMFDEDEVQTTKLIGGLIGTGALLIPNIPAVQAKRIMDAAASDPDSGYEAWAAAVFGWDRSPVGRQQ